MLEGPMAFLTDSAKASSNPHNPDITTFIATLGKHPAQNNVEALTFRPDHGGPSILHLKRDREDNTRPLMTLELCRLLEKSITTYDVMTPIMKNVWGITFSL
jgi:hypothetical protein